jgi:hypothetical protein
MWRSGQAEQLLQVRAGLACVVFAQKSHHASPTRPAAQSEQIRAISVFAVLLQKSHHASPEFPFAQLLQICAMATCGLVLPQKLQCLLMVDHSGAGGYHDWA